MIAFIYIGILILNIVAILLTYKVLGKDMDKKSKGIFIAVGIAVIYLLVSFVYWLGTKDIDLGVNSETGKNLITFTFVPVNAIIMMPFLASSYRNWKDEMLKNEPFRNRCILMGFILLIVLIIEFFYFKDIQNGILSILQAQH